MRSELWSLRSQLFSCYPGFPMSTTCLGPPPRGLVAAGVDVSSADVFCFFACRVDGAWVVDTVLSGLASPTFLLRDLGWECDCGGTEVEAEAFEEVAAADEGSAASFVAERVTLEDMRN